MALPRLFRPAEVAEALQQSENYVLMQCRAGRWPHVRVARGAIRLTAENYADVLRICGADATAQAPGSTPSAPALTSLSATRRRRSGR